mmetsp:Transcript_83/g.359  ORF Transcript_83/g.359 Transcript_83/m.359 type:complete len:904 (+) Transcript_83:147-2858(+)
MEKSPIVQQEAGAVEGNATASPKATKDDDNKSTTQAKTRHEEEAMAALIHAVQNERGETLRKTGKSGLNLNSKMMNADEPETTTVKRQTDQLSLAETAQCLMALHGDEDTPDTAEDKNKQNLSDVGATDRIVQTASLFKAAAAIGNNSTASSSPTVAAHQTGEVAEDNRQEDGSSNISNSRHTKTSVGSKARRAVKAVAAAAQQEWASVKDFYRPKQETITSVVLYWVCFVVLPSLAIAFVLFYGVENPPTGYCDSPLDADPNNPCNGEEASGSWWILFIGCRHVMIYLLAKLSDTFFIDFVLLQHAGIVRLLGPRVTLILVQAKGWPSLMWNWGVYTSLLLYGTNSFANHWLYFQNGLRIFNDENPSGTVTSAASYGGLILIAYLVPITVCLKRHSLGLHMGARLYVRYNERLQNVLLHVLLITELSLWVRKKRDRKATFTHFQRGESSESLSFRFRSKDDRLDDGNPQTGDEVQRESSTGNEVDMDFASFLDPWTEPERKNGEEDVSGKHIIEFQQALTVLTRPSFFSSAFGTVESRDECTKSSELLFCRILKIMDSNDESFNLADLTEWMFKGCNTAAEQQKAKELEDLLCPDKEGLVYIVDFIGSIDEVYKKVRMLEHAVNNASHIDKSYEALVNIVFYFVVGVVCLHILGLNPWTIIIPLGAFIFSLAFMIGDAASQIFEGMVLVLARQAYDVGDKIAIADVDDPASLEGSTHWLVEHVDLMKTVAKLVGTNELASFSNGSLARARLLNMNRSPDACVYVYVRFAIGTPYSIVMLLKSAVEKFVEARPQEWIQLLGFRTNRVEVEQNFVEYIIVLKHQNAWQNLVPIKESKALVASFCVEAQKKLGCHYQEPPKNIEVTIGGSKQDRRKKMDEQFQVEEASINELLELAQTFGVAEEE